MKQHKGGNFFSGISHAMNSEHLHCIYGNKKKAIFTFSQNFDKILSHSYELSIIYLAN